jgi:hypothetical protein
MALMFASAVGAQDALGSNPPVFQTIGMLDTEAHLLTEADCRVCHNSGVPDRHHVLYDQGVAGSSVAPYPEYNNGDLYTCMSCHGDAFALVRDCLQCHNTGSPHHTTQDAFDRHCTACHGDLVADFDDGHYIPSYGASLVTPWRGLNGDGYANAPYPTPDVASDGSGAVTPADVEQTEGGPPYFSINSTPLDEVQTRNQPNVLSYKPAGVNNDFVIGSTHHGGEEYSVVFTADTTLSASWNAATQTLSVTLGASQTALEVVDAINAATGGDDVDAELGYDGDGSAAPLPSVHFEPIGGNPPNNRGFGAGSCSYCHDEDGALDANGDPAPVLIVNNHDTHHHIGLPLNMSDGAGGTWRRCNVCHDYTDRGGSYREQSGPNFDLHIRICEECHSPETLHNIQADSNGDGAVVVGGELAGYGHVGRDAGPGDSDCWGCHGFAAAATAPLSGPVVPTIYSPDTAVVNGGTATAVNVTGAAFTNTTEGVDYSSDVKLTAADGSSVVLTPDAIAQDVMGVTIPADTAAGNYNLQALKADAASNPAVITVKPKVKIARVARATGKSTLTIQGSGFGGYAAGSGTSVAGTLASGSVEAAIVSWSDTKIEADFGDGAIPDDVTVNSVFGSDTAQVARGKRGRGRRK